MKILFICDQFDQGNNGTTISARRFAERLELLGNEVRVVSTGDPRPGKYTVRELHLPIFDRLISSHGMLFAHSDPNVLQEAIGWADIVHFYMPFRLSCVGERICRKQGVPRTAAYHVQPENITYSIGMGRWTWLNNLIYWGFRQLFYRRFNHIHCPSSFIANELRQHGYRAKLHVISNGIEPDFVYRKLPKTDELAEKFSILMTGRLSNEKRQDLLIEGIRRSKYADKIQLILAGQGPRHDHITALGSTLPNPPIIRFFTKAELLDIIAMSDLYVHAADAEIEAIACIEAFASGLVPVIANSPKSATPQFALDERSLFTAGDADSLAQKIDYWIEHPEERAEMEHRYAEHGHQYAIDQCAVKMQEMFEKEIAERAVEPPELAESHAMI